jgi:MFS-type transporter involved in bile tolerance (Atg22 family)
MKALIVIAMILIFIGGSQAVDHLEGGVLAKALLFVCGMMFGFVVEAVNDDNK